ncbi:aminopeptidase A-like isoform X2 [Periplaneta americana]
MDQVGETENYPEAGLTTVEFRESVPMVTYLSCFIVCDFKRLDPVTISQGFPFSVYATPGQVNKTKYALEVGVNITEFYIRYFCIPYPLPKLDMIAIPDFVSGAMEHWGLITFREVNLLYEEGISSTFNKQRVATVVGHELAHMWFGNLMTLEWWDDLWLNEGFASYIEYKGVNHAHPDWHMLDQFLIEDLHRVLVLDASVTSHPIVQTVGHPDEITELFDSISYSKGASVIRMLEDFLGEKEFRDGITAFLNKFKFANAVTQDLWNQLQTVAKDVNVTRVMDTWTRQMGFPVVTATRDHNGAVTIKQSRFLSDPNANVTDDSPFGYKWDIPISYITSKSNSVQRTWLNSDDESTALHIPNDVAWFKINSHQKGYYRVNYDEENWGKIIDVLKTEPTALHSTDRAHLLDDAFSLAEAGLLNYETAMEMTRYLKNESDYVPWQVAANKFNGLGKLLVSSTFYAKYRKYLACLMSSVYHKVTMVVSEDDPHLTRLLRPTIAQLACRVGVQECVNETIEMFKNWINNVKTAEKPHPDIRSHVYGQGLKLAGGEREWDIMWNLYLNETDAQERIKLLSGLAHSSEPWILKRYIELSKNETNVRSQDYFTVLSFISHNPVGTPIVWDFIRDEWQYLVDRFTLNDRYLGRMVPVVTSSFSSELKLKEMETFFKEYPDAGAGKTGRSQALDHVRKNINWLNRHSKSLGDWINRVDAVC